MTSETSPVPVRVVLRGGQPVLEEVAPNPVVLAALEKARQEPPPEPEPQPEPQPVVLDEDLDENGVPRWLGDFDPQRAIVYGERVRAERTATRAE